MKIEAIKVDHFVIPLPHTVTDAIHGDQSDFGVITVRIMCEGIEGLGYTYTVRDVGSDAIRSVIEKELCDMLIGMDPRRIELIWQKMWNQVHYVGRGGIATFAMSAVDIALWDMKSKMANEPLWRTLGGYSGKAQVYAGGIDLHLSTDELIEQTQRNLDHGYRAIKMKVGAAKLKDDIARIERMKDYLGDDILLMVDANMSWSVAQAIDAARAMRDYDIYWFEEPTIPDDIEGHARIASEGGVPLATGENLHTLYEFQKMIAGGNISYPEPDISNIGGITGWMKVAHLAEAHNLPVTTHGIHDLHVHLLGAVSNASLLEAHGFGLEAFITEPLEIVDGWSKASDRPGHGVEFLWDKLEQHKQ